MTKKSKGELQAEVRLLKQSHISDAIARVLSDVVRYGVFGFLGYRISLVLLAWTGEITIAEISVSFLGKIGVSRALPWIVVGTAIFYGHKQKKLRQSTIERLQERITALERQIDPGRTSSKLTTRGETRQEDL